MNDQEIRTVVTPFFYNGVDVALQTIVAPAANTKGVVVHGASASVNTNNGKARVMWKTSAPSGVTDAAAGTLAYRQGFAAGPESGVVGGVGFPLILPPGVGLYAQKSDAGDAGFSCDYRIIL